MGERRDAEMVTTLSIMVALGVKLPCYALGESPGPDRAGVQHLMGWAAQPVPLMSPFL